MATKATRHEYIVTDITPPRRNIRVEAVSERGAKIAATRRDFVGVITVEHAAECIACAALPEPSADAEPAPVVSTVPVYTVSCVVGRYDLITPNEADALAYARERAEADGDTSHYVVETHDGGAVIETRHVYGWHRRVHGTDDYAPIYPCVVCGADDHDGGRHPWPADDGPDATGARAAGRPVPSVDAARAAETERMAAVLAASLDAGDDAAAFIGRYSRAQSRARAETERADWR